MSVRVLPWPHGTTAGYRTYRCRCEHCTEAHRYEVATERAARTSELPPGDPRHGLNGYGNYRCRCDICFAAKSKANAAANARRRAAR
jgi:hypothetical protein